jgi:integrase
MLVLVLKGDDPVWVKRQQRSAGTTFRQACEEFKNKHQAKWRNLRHVNVYLGKHIEPLADTAVRLITPDMIADAILPLYKQHPKQARRVLRTWVGVFDYGKVKGYRSKDQDNPAKWGGTLEHILPHIPYQEKHYPDYPFKDIPELIIRLRWRQGRGETARAIEFQILTAARPGEVRNMRWSDVDLVNCIWKQSPEQTELKRRYRTPLCSRCMEILGVQFEYRPDGDFVFQGYNRRALDQKAMKVLLQRMDVPVTTPSSFRKSFRNWGARHRPKEERFLLEMCLGHDVKGKVEKAYWTEDALAERRGIMDAWAAYCG